GGVSREWKHLSDVFPIGSAETAAERDGMLPAVHRQRVVYCGNEMAAGSVWLVNKRDSRAHRIRSYAIGELQIAADAQWHVIVPIEVTIFGARIGVAAVLHAVAELVEGLGPERRLQRSGINEVAQAERTRPLDLRYWQTPFARLPAMPVIPGKGHLLFRRD